MRIWTFGYNAFVMGGSCWQPIACEVPTEALGDPVEICGVTVRPVVATTGETFYVEARHGSLHGTSIDVLRSEIEKADPAVVEEQIAESATRCAQADTLDPAEFWRRVGRGGRS